REPLASAAGRAGGTGTCSRSSESACPRGKLGRTDPAAVGRHSAVGGRGLGLPSGSALDGLADRPQRARACAGLAATPLGDRFTQKLLSGPDLFAAPARFGVAPAQSRTGPGSAHRDLAKYRRFGRQIRSLAYTGRRRDDRPGGRRYLGPLAGTVEPAQDQLP